MSEPPSAGNDAPADSHLPVEAVRQNSRSEELESLRGLAALVVIFFHLPKWHPWLDNGVVNNGYLMVELFFVLSGYVIYTAYSDHLKSFSNLARFQWLRFGRLYPLHILFLAAFLSIEILKLFSASSRSQAFQANSLQALMQQIFLLQAVLPGGDVYTFNTPAWSISVEFYTYLLFAIIVVVARRFKDIVFLTVAAFSISWLCYYGKTGSYLVFECLTGFMAGCLTSLLLGRLSFRLPAFFLISLFSIFIAYLFFKPTEKLDLFIFPLSAALIVALLRTSDGRLRRLMRSRPLGWLGALSYSAYMSHSFIISLELIFMQRVLHLPEYVGSNGGLTQLVPAWGAAIAVIVAFIMVFGVSQLIHRYIEVPLREKSRTLARQWWAADLR